MNLKPLEQFSILLPQYDDHENDCDVTYIHVIVIYKSKAGRNSEGIRFASIIFTENWIRFFFAVYICISQQKPNPKLCQDSKALWCSTLQMNNVGLGRERLTTPKATVSFDRCLCHEMHPSDKNHIREKITPVEYMTIVIKSGKVKNFVG